MAGKEADQRGTSEKFFERTRNFALVVAFLGLVAMLASPIGEVLFVGGGAGAVAGEAGRQAVTSGKPARNKYALAA